jgi:hypothetical protein
MPDGVSPMTGAPVIGANGIIDNSGMTHGSGCNMTV